MQAPAAPCAFRAVATLLTLVPLWDYHSLVHIVSRSTLVDFYSQPDHRDVRGALEAWYDVARLAKRTSPADVKASYGNASIVGNNRAMFNIKRNDYRLVVAIAYRMQWVYVKFVGTHAQYDQIDVETVDQSK
jgi:mRNA interferase HigB